MQLNIEQSELKRVLSIAARAIPSRSIAPILLTVLLETELDSDQIKLTSTNLEFSISVKAKAVIKFPGKTSVPAKLLTDFVARLSGDVVTLKLDEATNTLKVSCGKSKANIKCLPADEFPVIVNAVDSNQPTVEIDPDVLKDLISKTVFAASVDTIRPILNGVNLAFDKGKITASSADGFRLSVYKVDADFDFTGKAIVPAVTLSELHRILGSIKDKIAITLPDSAANIMFSLPDITLISQLIAGDYPDLNAVIPVKHNTRAIIPLADLSNAATIAELFARDAANIIKFDLDPDNGVITLSSKSSELGDNESTIMANIEGDPVAIAFNVRYIISALSAVDTDNVVIEINTASNPAKIIPESSDNRFIHVVMPMAIK